MQLVLKIKVINMENYRSLCPVNLSLETFGDKWSLIIIRDIMFEGKRSFRELLQSAEKMATNILAGRLEKLEKEGIINKADDPEHKQKHIYSLTAKGIDLLPIMVEIGAWSIKHKPVDLKKHKHAVELVKGGKELQKEIRKELIKKHLK
jgi:DNA-binding HxlR family transcriptional regulator